MIHLKKLEPVRLFEQVVEQIRELISRGELNPGDKLPSEQELEKQLKVSRSSIREALRVLEVEGFVEVRRGSGTYITAVKEKNRTRGEITRWLEQREDVLISVLQMREYVEGLTASLAASLATQETIDDLNDILRQTGAVIERCTATNEEDFDLMTELDSRFHLVISEASGNIFAMDTITQIVPAFQESNKAVVYMGERLDNFYKDHNAIKVAIEARNPRAAEDAMRQHIVRVRSELEKILHGSSDEEAEELA